MTEPLWTVHDVAAHLGVSERTARRRIAEWRLARLVVPAGRDAVTGGLLYHPDAVRAAAGGAR